MPRSTAHVAAVNALPGNGGVVSAFGAATVRQFKQGNIMAAKKPNILILWGDDIGWWNIMSNNHRKKG